MFQAENSLAAIICWHSCVLNPSRIHAINIQSSSKDTTRALRFRLTNRALVLWLSRTWIFLNGSFRIHCYYTPHTKYWLHLSLSNFIFLETIVAVVRQGDPLSQRRHSSKADGRVCLRKRLTPSRQTTMLTTISQSSWTQATLSY